MKKIFFAAALIGLTLVSCGDDDSAVANVAIEGNWKLTGFTLDEPVDFNQDGTASVNLIGETGCYTDSGIVFSGTGQAVVSLEGLDVELVVEGGIETINIDCLPADVAIGPYTVTENTVVLSGNAGEGDQDVVLTRSGNTLSVYFPEIQDVPVEGGGEAEVVGATLTFTKQ
ncbi:MAG: lipocalin family protein [Flavobacterium sp.]